MSERDAFLEDLLAIPVITLDVDWAPDFVIDAVADRFRQAGVRSTWFVTHSSPAVSRLRQSPDLFELGVHPNFLPGSTHGDTPEAVLEHVLGLVPEARSMRTHGLVQSTQLLDLVIRRTPIAIDVTAFLPRTPNLRPFPYPWQGGTLWRVPFFWEDDFEMERSRPCWTLAPYLDVGPGLKVFNFHPIHVYLNSPDMAPYRALKAEAPDLRAALERTVDRHRYGGAGTATLLEELLEYLAACVPGRSRTIADLVSDWKRVAPSDDDPPDTGQSGAKPSMDAQAGQNELAEATSKSGEVTRRDGASTSSLTPTIEQEAP